MKKTITLFLFLLAISNILAQTTKDLQVDRLYNDSIITPLKKPILAVAEVFAINMGVWAFDRYVIEGHYAYISMNSMKRNLRKGFYWDNDNFGTNHFNHPYHGAAYFGAARSNGMNYWQSGLYALGGSMMWELFMECELPSTNDLIATSIGGVALGESFYRTTDLILDNSATGWNRIWREGLSLLLSPGRGLNRLITGESWKKAPKSLHKKAKPDTQFEISLGARSVELLNLDEELIDEGVGLSLDVKMTYGNLYEYDDTTPYDFFHLRGSFNFQKQQPIIGQINILGRLWGKRLYSSAKNEIHTGIFQHFDYYDSDTLANTVDLENTKTPYEMGSPASVGIGFIHKGNNSSKTWKFYSQLHINGIILGSSLSDYYRGNERKYNWGSGYAVKGFFGISYKDKIELFLGAENYHIFTWKGYDPDINWEEVNYSTLNVQGDRSNALYDIVISKLTYHINKKLSASIHQYNFFRTTNYTYLPNISSTTYDSRLICTYHF